MQNLIVLMESTDNDLWPDPDDPLHMCLKGGNMCLNRFCIDEDASFELYGVRYLVPWTSELYYDAEYFGKDYEDVRKEKVKGNKRSQSTVNFCALW